jgi:MFS family permease
MDYKWIAVTVTSVGVLMAGIDTRIVIIGLPSVGQSLKSDVEPLIWVTQSYLLASTIGLLLIGRVTDLFGRVKIYNIGFSIFTIGSAFSGLAPTVFYLIAARAVQGIGASMLITNSAAILTDSSPKGELGYFLGINQIAFRVGSVVGLTISGIILAVADWRVLVLYQYPSRNFRYHLGPHKIKGDSHA